MKCARLAVTFVVVGIAYGCFIQTAGPAPQQGYGQPGIQQAAPVAQPQYANPYPATLPTATVQPVPPQQGPVMYANPQPVVVQTASQPGTISIVNATGDQICYLYISVAGEDWGSDRLGRTTTLEAGRTFLVYLDPGSRFDLLAEDCDHQEVAKYSNRRLPSDGIWSVEFNGSGRVRSHGDEPTYVATSSGYDDEGYDDDDQGDDEDDDSSSSGAGGLDDSCRSCSISTGSISSCGSWYSGDAVALSDGSYRTCHISMGSITSCGSWYSGDAVVLNDGSYRTCHISMGSVTSCGSWFSGTSVVCPE